LFIENKTVELFSVHFGLIQNEPKNQGGEFMSDARHRCAAQFQRSLSLRGFNTRSDRCEIVWTPSSCLAFFAHEFEANRYPKFQ